MKSLIFTFLCLPIFLFAQSDLRVNFTIEKNVLRSFDLAPQDNSQYVQMDLTSGSGITSSFSLEKELNKTWSWHNGLTYSAQSFILNTGFDYSNLITNILIPAVIIPIETDTRHRINFSSIALFTGISLKESFGKFGIQTGLFIGGERYLHFETESIVVNEFARDYGEKVDIEGDDQPNKLYAFGRFSTGFFYDLTPVLRISGTPFFNFNFNKTKAAHLDNRFYKFGVALGLSYQM